ncbi:hypothetical protein PAXRUDRAFT_833961 [Paxillus rubicundulus Ve08.2h10]|uniref:Uncharacterized protein n=1 Tax=Paxillus rubicundulus Ve08.2h10 TaxID=930991 RepID=A0A0D0DMK8_9AGAM|nr:hypothetical protein PAXRUDRAFT_833961 [Paxillus rubicundulus Ve08.2h10]
MYALYCENAHLAFLGLQPAFTSISSISLPELLSSSLNSAFLARFCLDTFAFGPGPVSTQLSSSETGNFLGG